MTAPPFATSALLAPVSHGFFDRRGGVSPPPFDTLNCGPGSSDKAENVIENRRRAAEALCPGATLFTAWQHHSADAVLVTTPDQPQPKADALVTKRDDIVLGVLTADCIPVLFSAPSAGLVAAAHAGWRGALSGILESTIALMQEQGADPAEIRAAVGPCLRPPAFQVGDDLRGAFTGKYPESVQWFTSEPAGRYQLDLVGFARWRMENAGLDPEKIDDIGGNTLAQPDRYFSYRHVGQTGQPDYGRDISAITLGRA